MTEQEFDRVIAPDDPVIVKFSAPWCGPCKALAPALDEVAKETGMRLVEVDVDQSPEIVGSYRVRGLPTVMVFKSGKPVVSMVGAATSDQILALIEGSV